MNTKKLLLFLFAVALGAVQAAAQTAKPLSFDSNRAATITTNDTHYYIPTDWLTSLPVSGLGHACTLTEVQEIRTAHALVGLDPKIFIWRVTSPIG
ncbi:MAG: hypothetical protein LBH61_07665, partial [Dysgonamonadaceae bacterium]|nr:hypothetical protein [Dysgonamonadaceae bacterium]